ncbi:uncharacterized protein LOC127102805 [Lathyrus oleraceus]|uniref:uncharacterized protein LOC127102805 n=1 Tax=Pisum sativum TaxID=3888 RepID=UPI0021CFAD32|nr:uncharacterized protein LOC127102805 [Pisum sativum]
MAHWQMLLSEYNIEYRTQEVVKGSIFENHLAHQPINDYQSIRFDFLDEDVMYLKAKDYDEQFPEEGPKPGSGWGLVFDGAVNAYGNGIGEIIITPMALVVNQIKGEWETRHPGLIPYKDYARRFSNFFNKIKSHHIPHKENQMANALATLCSMYKVKLLK